MVRPNRVISFSFFPHPATVKEIPRALLPSHLKALEYLMTSRFSLILILRGGEKKGLFGARSLFIFA